MSFAKGLAAFLFVVFATIAATAPPASAQTAAAGGATEADPAAAAASTPGALAPLLEALRDPQARDALIAELERLSGSGEPAAHSGDDAEAPLAPEPTTFGRRIAELTQTVAEDIAKQAQTLWRRAQSTPRAISAAFDISPGFLAEALFDLALVFAATVAIFLTLRGLAKRAFRSLGDVAATSGAGRTLLLIVLTVAIDAAVVLLAWAGGYVVALLALGSSGEMGIRQTLYLNAFLLVEMAKVLIRAVTTPSSAHLRMMPIPTAGARTIARWLGLAASIIGYGQLLVVPIVSRNVSFFAGRGVSTLAALMAIAVLIWAVLRHRRTVANWLSGTAAPGSMASRLAGAWHVPAMAYLLGLLVVVLTRPGDMLFSVLWSSAQILAAVLAGVAAAHALDRAMARGVSLPPALTERLPLLERRLNAFVPRALQAARLLVALAVAGFAIHSVGLVDVQAWLASATGARIAGGLVALAIVVVIAFAVWLAMSSWVDWRLNPAVGLPATAREQTLLSLLRNAATIMILVFALMFGLSEIGIDIAPLIASAGVLGLAIGFGAQKLVQDIITGVFIQLENAINVGDVVTVGGVTAVVERLTIRSVSLRDLHGTFHIVPFSSVDMVSNFNKEFAYHVADMGIAYREDVEEAKQAMQEAFDAIRAMPEWAPHILADLQWFGVQTLGDSAVVVRARIRCGPGQQWGVGRAYNEACKRAFDARGIEIPFPHMTIWFGEDKQGAAPPARIASTAGPVGGPAPGDAAG